MRNYFPKIKHLFHPISIFVIAQISWGLLMIIWIRWYVLRTSELDKVFLRLSDPGQFETGHWIILWEGCILMGVILAGLYLVFLSFRKQVRLNKLQDSILNSVTHELKTPLASIRLYTETLILRNLSTESQVKFYKKILSESERLQTQIDRILITARQESNQDKVPKHVCDLTQLLMSSIQKAQERFGESRTLNVEIVNQDKLPLTTLAPSLHIEILLDNLIENAVKYSEIGGFINIKMFTDEDIIFLEICDDGIGIEKKYLKKVFSKFFRVEDKTFKRISGSGLGLHVCQSIVKSIGGRIFAHSEGLQKGACFHVEFQRHYPSH